MGGQQIKTKYKTNNIEEFVHKNNSAFDRAARQNPGNLIPHGINKPMQLWLYTFLRSTHLLYRIILKAFGATLNVILEI